MDVLRQTMKRFLSFLIIPTFLFVLAADAFAKRDPDEFRMTCKINTSLFSKALQGLIVYWATDDGWEKVKAKVKLQADGPKEKDEFFSDDIIGKLKLKGNPSKGFTIGKNPKFKLKDLACSQEFDVVIQISGIDPSGRKNTTTKTTQGVTLKGFFE